MLLFTKKRNIDITTPKRLPVFGARTFSTVITTSLVQDLNEKIAGIDCMMR
jgi:hypothetical protein